MTHPTMDGEEDPFLGFFISDEERLRRESEAEHRRKVFSQKDDVAEFLGLRIGPERYACDISRIQEIIKVPHVTKVPRLGAEVLGIMSLRGTIVPVVDLRRILGLRIASMERDQRVLVMRTDAEPVGFMVDQVMAVVRVPRGQIEPKPATLHRSIADLVIGVTRIRGDLWTVLDDIAALARVKTL